MPLTPRTWQLLIAGVDRSDKVSRRSLTIEQTRGSRGLLSLDLVDDVAGPTAYVPALDQEVILRVENVRRFGGFITDIAHAPLGGFQGTRSSVKVGAYDMALDRVTVTETYGNTLIPIYNAAIASPTFITTDGPHGFKTGERVRIEGVQYASPPVVNGDHIATAMEHWQNFSIPVNVTIAAGGGGTARRLWTLREVLTDLSVKYLSQFGISLVLNYTRSIERWLLEQAEYARWVEPTDSRAWVRLSATTQATVEAALATVMDDLGAVLADIGQQEAFTRAYADAVAKGFVGERERFLLQQVERQQWIPAGDARITAPMPVPVQQAVQAILGTIDERLYDALGGMDADERAAVEAAYEKVTTYAMGDGPMMEPLEFTNAKMTDVLNYFATSHKYLHRVTPDQQLIVFEGGSTHSGVAFNGTNTNAPVGWEQSRKQYVNRVIVSIGGAQKIPQTQIFNSDGALTGDNLKRYVTIYPTSSDINADPWPNLLIVNDAVAGPVFWGPTPGQPWYWDFKNHQLVHQYQFDVQFGHVPLPAGTKVTVSYTAVFPVDVMAEDPIDVQPPPVGKGPWEERFAVATITDLSQGKAVAEGLLRQLKVSARSVTLGSAMTNFVYPADMATLDFPKRLIVPSDWMIESVTSRLLNPYHFYHEYSFTEGTEAIKTWADYVKELTRQPAGGLGGVSPPISLSFPPSAPPPPGSGTSGATGGGWFLGGDGTTSVLGVANQWLPIDGSTTQIGGAATQVEMDTAVLGKTSVQVRARLRALTAGVGVRARLWRCDAGGQEVGASLPVVSTAWTTVEFSCSLTTGAHPYECHIQPDTALRDVMGTAYIK